MMGNISMVEKLIDTSTRKQDIRGLTALMYASKVNEVEVLNLLKEKENKMTDKAGMTALMYAAARGFSEAVAAL